MHISTVSKSLEDSFSLSALEGDAAVRRSKALRAIGHRHSSAWLITSPTGPGTVTRTTAESWRGAEIGRLFHIAASELHSYPSLPAKWNGYGSDPIGPESILTGLRVLRTLRRQLLDREVVPREVTPSPLADGGIAIEVAVEDRTLILTVSSNATTVSVYREANGTHTETDVDAESLDLDQFSSWLIRAVGRATDLV